MSNHNRADLGHVYDRLQDEGFTPTEEQEKVFRSDNRNDSPWFIQGLMGCGGWIAAVFLLASSAFCVVTMLSGIGGQSLGFILTMMGVIFTVGTTLQSNSRDDDSGVFVDQILLSIHLAGHALLIVGFVLNLTYELQIVVSGIFTIIVQIIFIRWYRNPIYRFLGMLIIASALVAISFEHTIPLVISLATGVFIVLGIVIWADKLPTHIQIEQMSLLHPVGYGAVVGAFGMMIYEVTNRYFYYREIPPNTAYITTAILFACLLWVERELLIEYGVRLASRFAVSLFIVTALVALPLLGVTVSATDGLAFGGVSTPGILAAIVVILLAFRRRNRILLGLSYLYLGGFISYYYYWLDVTLFTKSLILMTTGGLLIAARLYLRRTVSVPDEKKGKLA